MCGICGMFDSGQAGRDKEEIVRQMSVCLKHRGPDMQSIYRQPNLTLGFNRLSIIGLDNGYQPIQNENKTILLLCCGEIYNYQELKKELESKNHYFSTNTDVEVILHLYEELKYKCLSKLNGQFAFFIYNDINKSVFCARDHVGIAPFYYYFQNDLFIFSSEVSSILEYKDIDRKLNMHAVDQFLTFPGVMAPHTFIENVYSLPSGHFLTIQNSKLHIHKYWDLNFTQKVVYQNEDAYIEHLDYLLDKAISRRLQSDVPVGFYLSGGLDSSLIGYKSIKISSNSMHSFSIYFDDPGYTEKSYQDIISSYLNTKHHSQKFTVDDIAELLPLVVFYSGAPLKETYNTASYQLSRMAMKNGIKVILTGEGADELLAGYMGYLLDDYRYTNKETVSDEEKQIRRLLWRRHDFLYEKNYSNFEMIKKRLYSRDVYSTYSDFNCINGILPLDKIKNLDILDLRTYVDFKYRLSDHLLMDHGDKMAFANSVEARYPFLDIDVIDFCTRIPPKLKIINSIEKYLLKKLGQRIIPRSIYERPKFCFVAPGSPELVKRNYSFINYILSPEIARK